MYPTSVDLATMQPTLQPLDGEPSKISWNFLCTKIARSSLPMRGPFLRSNSKLSLPTLRAYLGCFRILSFAQNSGPPKELFLSSNPSLAAPRQDLLLRLQLSVRRLIADLRSSA